VTKSIFIKKNKRPFIVAEVGVNHECSILEAKKMILSAKKGGADAVKFQTYKAELIASKNSPAYWDTKKEKSKSQYELFKKYDQLNLEDYQELYNFCNKNKILFASTPFDLEAVDNLDSLLKFYKISSSDITNFPLIEKISKKNKPVILSTGASNINEITEAVKILKKNTKKEIVIMHCILCYPTKNEDANLGMIKDLEEKFKGCIIGYSDHTLPDKKMSNLTTAFLLGAKVIEKHFTLNKKMKGNDHYHAMDLRDLKEFNVQLSQHLTIIGSYKKMIIPNETKSKKYARRSLVLNSPLKKNQIIKKNNLIAKRPGTGISPVNLKLILGKKINKNLPEDHILKWNDVT
jgi:sialic acid synthase SpsE